MCIDCGRRELRARSLAERQTERSLNAAVAEGRRQDVPDTAAELGVAMLEPDAVPFSTERIAHDVQLVRMVSGVAQQDRAVGSDGIDAAIQELRDALHVAGPSMFASPLRTSRRCPVS